MHEGFLFSQLLYAQIVDFGRAREHLDATKTATARPGTLVYAAPETLKAVRSKQQSQSERARYNRNIDVWS